MTRDFIGSLKKEFTNYNSTKLTKDIMAGFAVAAVALPLALAFGVSSGATAASGLITAIIAGLVMSAFSGGYYQISGPTGAMAAILMSLVVSYGMDGVFIATFLAGILLLLAGILHLGKLTTFIPAPVVTGFTSGISIIIILGQLDHFFGSASQGSSAIEKLLSYWKIGFSPNIQTIALGLFVIFFMFLFPKKWNQVVPSSLLSIILATAISIFMNLDMAVVGVIPKTLIPDSRLLLSSLSLSGVSGLILPAFSIAILGMIESLLCGASAERMTSVRLDSNQELMSQGIGNIILPFFGGIPATAAIARTSVAIKSGAQTRLTGIFHAVGLLISMFLLAPVMSQIPLSALAGVLIVTAWKMNDWTSINYMFSRKFKGACVKYIATMLGTIVFDLTVAILIGVLIGLITLVVRISDIEINYERVDMDRIPTDDPILRERYRNAKVAYITGPMIFANAHNVSDIINNVENCDTLLLSMRGVSHIDISCAQALHKLVEDLRELEVDVVVCGVPLYTMDMMRRSGLDKIIGEDNFYWSAERVLMTNRPKPSLNNKESIKK